MGSHHGWTGLRGSGQAPQRSTPRANTPRAAVEESVRITVRISTGVEIARPTPRTTDPTLDRVKSQDKIDGPPQNASTKTTRGGVRTFTNGPSTTAMVARSPRQRGQPVMHATVRSDRRAWTDLYPPSVGRASHVPLGGAGGVALLGARTRRPAHRSVAVFRHLKSMRVPINHATIFSRRSPEGHRSRREPMRRPRFGVRPSARPALRGQVRTPRR